MLSPVLEVPSFSKAEYNSTVWMDTFCVSIHPSMATWAGPPLAVVNAAAVGMVCQ